jgi:hypothetical protein
MEDNKLIAEFMGHTFADFDLGGLHYLIDGNYVEYISLQYHTSWDWLMPVVREVIIRYQVDEGIEIDYDELQRRVMDNDIERAYEEVVEFIKQYNNETIK